MLTTHPQPRRDGPPARRPRHRRVEAARQDHGELAGHRGPLSVGRRALRYRRDVARRRCRGGGVRHRRRGRRGHATRVPLRPPKDVGLPGPGVAEHLPGQSGRDGVDSIDRAAAMSWTGVGADRRHDGGQIGRRRIGRDGDDQGPSVRRRRCLSDQGACERGLRRCRALAESLGPGSGPMASAPARMAAWAPSGSVTEADLHERLAGYAGHVAARPGARPQLRRAVVRPSASAPRR